MSIWAISDPHLSFGVPNKSMEAFGSLWTGYEKKMEENWRALIKSEDLVLIPGDISWAMRMEDAIVDLKWIDALPGTKLILKGNHDFWWSSAGKLAKVLPPSIHFIQNNCFNWNDVSIGGSRLWDSEEYRFGSFVEYQENPRAQEKKESAETDEKIFNRELERLKLSLKQLNPKARVKIAMTHYPPIGADLKPSRASSILEEYGINICVFGHLHSLKTKEPFFGEARGIKYYLTSCDYLDFTPLKIL
jgi:predicted phosphohydrolase